MLIKPVVLHSDDGTHRQSNWLELLFDLAFVISVSVLSHYLISNASAPALGLYAALFLPVWWVWNQYTWYASQFDNGDSIFRAFMILAIGGVLVLSVGLKNLFSGDPVLFAGAYLFLHVILMCGWLRAYKHVVSVRPYSRYKMAGIAGGLVLVSMGLLVDGQARLLLWAAALIVQLALPMLAWATVKNVISVHHGHLAERHGLFTMIVLGESFVALVNGWSTGFWLPYALCFLMVVSLWWIYFEWKFDPVSLESVVRVFTMNYGHMLVYSGLGVFAAGIATMSVRLLCLGSGVFLLTLTAMSLASGFFLNRCTGSRFGAAVILLVLSSMEDGLPMGMALPLIAFVLLGVAGLSTQSSAPRV